MPVDIRCNFAAEIRNKRIIMARTYKYQSIKNAIAKMDVDELISEFNALVGKNYWCSARAAHDVALIDTLIKEGVDVSAIYDGKAISFARKVVLNDDKTKVLFA